MSSTAQVEEFAKLLQKHVKSAVIIDDAYDLTFAASVDADKLLAFTTIAKAETAVSDELVANGIDLDAVSKGQEDALIKLASQRAKYEKARPAVELLLMSYFEQRDPLSELATHLDNLKIPVVPLGVATPLPAGLKADIAFIDYYLEQEPPLQQDPNDKKDYGAKAREKAQAIYTSTRAHIVLMSNRSGVKQLETEFRRRAKLLKGYFRFAPKEDLSKGDLLRAMLSVLPLEAEFRHKLHDFVDLLEQRVDSVKTAFMADVRNLGLEDYAQLRQLCLNKEGHPFGDYILRLFGAFLTSLVVEDSKIMEQVTELDETTFESLLPIQDEPSDTLGRIYLASLTERLRKPPTGQGATGITNLTGAKSAPPPETSPTVAEETPPLATTDSEASVNAPQVVASALLRVEFGDLFVKDSDLSALAVMNPACDLVIGGKRKREETDTVLLLPGRLCNLHEPSLGNRAPSFVTPIYLHKDKVYRIDWDYRKLATLPHNQLADAMKEYTHERRLQLGPALELQQHFISSTGRVGLPVSPPLGRSIDAAIYCRCSDGKWAEVHSTVPGACVVYHLPDKDQFVVFGPARERILAAIDSHFKVLKAVDAKVKWEGPSNRATYSTALQKLIAKWHVTFPFYRFLGNLPGSRKSSKDCESNDRLGVTVGTALFEKAVVDADVVLCLDLKPMVLLLTEDLPREMDEV